MSGPQGLVLVWTRRPADDLVRTLSAAGHLPAVVEPVETADLVETAGAPAALLLDPDLLAEASTQEALASLRARAPHVRVAVVADPGSSAEGLLAAMRAGLHELVDPADAESAARVLPAAGATAARVLAIGAHPDDVEIGCGATLLGHRNRGHAVTVLTLSQGAVGGPGEERIREASAAAAQMGAELLLADLPDTRMEQATEMIGLIEGVIAAVDPTVVYVHSAADNHQDHRAVHTAAVVAARRVPNLFCYQSPSSRNQFAPTRFVAVDDLVEEKVALLSHYRSQATRHYLEPDLVVATSRYWARQLTHTRYAEPFEVLRSSGDDAVPAQAVQSIGVSTTVAPMTVTVSTQPSRA